MFLSPVTDDPRQIELAECIRKSVAAGGGVVLDGPAPDALGVTLFDKPVDAETVEEGSRVAVYTSPSLPPVDWYAPLRSFESVIVPSDPVADWFRENIPGLSVDVAAPPIEFLEDVDASWLNWNSSDYRFYTLVPEHEIGVVYPLVKAFLSEYRSTDAVSLTVRVFGPRDEVEEALDYARDEIGLPNTKQGRVNLVFGKWDRNGMMALARWGDCLLCPWAGCWPPVEIGYAMAAGNFVAAPEWSAGSLLNHRNGSLLSYVLDPAGFAVLDWEQVDAVMRLAAANGRRERVPAKLAAKEILCETGHFSRILMAKLDLAPDLLDRGSSSAAIHRQPQSDADPAT